MFYVERKNLPEERQKRTDDARGEYDRRQADKRFYDPSEGGICKTPPSIHEIMQQVAPKKQTHD